MTELCLIKVEIDGVTRWLLGPDDVQIRTRLMRLGVSPVTRADPATVLRCEFDGVAVLKPFA